MLRARTPRHPAAEFPRGSAGHSLQPERILLRGRSRRRQGRCVPRSWFTLILVFLGSAFWLRRAISLRGGPDSTLEWELSPNDASGRNSDYHLDDGLLGSIWEDRIFTKQVKAPLVDRSFIQQLFQVEDEDEVEDVSGEREAFSQQRMASVGSTALAEPSEEPHWPPIVTALPESRSPAGNSRPQSSAPAGLLTEEVDARFCKHSPCRLLVPLALSGRDPKLQAHLTQLLALARALDRTLVLPNVGRGRAGLCLRWDFSVYFEIASLVRAGGSPVMLLDDFRTWADVRPRSPAAQFVSVDADEPELGLGLEPAPGSALFSVGDRVRVEVDDALDMDDAMLRSARCLKPKFRRLDLDSFSPLSVHLDPRAGQFPDERDTSPGTLLVQALSREDVKLAASGPMMHLIEDKLSLFAELDEGAVHSPNLQRIADPEILLVNWDTQLYLFSTASLEYSSKLWTLAEKLTASLAPYLAVHWHMEKVTPAVLPACAEELVDTLDMLLRDESLARGIDAVWFTIDYPYPVSWTRSREQSATAPVGKPRVLRDLKSEHSEAVNVVRTAFEPGGELSDWRLTRLADELARTSVTTDLGGGDDERLLLEDPGLLDILENMVAMKAALFVSSAKGCGKISASTKQIVEYRAHTRTADAPKNVVELFG